MEHLFVHSADHTRLHVVHLPPAAEARGDVVIVHGLAEHAGRYDYVMERLAAEGWHAWFLELRGHGDSEGRRGHVGAWADYDQDLLAVARHLDRPFHVLAHSMGGLVVLDAVLAGLPLHVASVALTNPLLGLALVAPRWKTLGATCLSAILPTLPIGNELEPAFLCHDAAVVEAYRQDPKVFKTVTPRWYAEMNRAMERVQAAAGVFLPPLLMITSTGDRICSPEQARHFVEASGGPHEHLVLQDLFHEVLNEASRDETLDRILAWFRDHPPTSPTRTEKQP